MLTAELEQRLFLLRRERFVVQGEGDVLIEFADGSFLGLGGQLFVHLPAPFGIEQLDPRFGQKAGRFIQPGAEQLGERIARLIFERQLFLPPQKQLAKALLDQLIARIGLRIETKPLVGIGRIIAAPAVPLARVVRQRNREADLLEHLRRRSIAPTLPSR